MISYNTDDADVAAVEEARATYADIGERTYEFARRIVRLYASLPKTALPQTLGKQVLRSGTSIGANYQEACGSRSRAEFVAKLGDCHKEARETEYWLRLMADEQVFSPDRLAPLRSEAAEITAILISSIRTSKGLSRDPASPLSS